MPPDQIILATVTPRAVAVDTETLPVSVFFTPRLSGGEILADFPDWLSWTSQIDKHGLSLTFRCAGNTLELAVDHGALRPDLWNALFGRETLVRPYAFDDYSDRRILSYSVRDTLSVLKSIYQTAAVTLALPDSGVFRDRQSNRRVLSDLLDGLEIHWEHNEAEKWRDIVAARAGRRRGPVDLDHEGLITSTPAQGTSHDAALPFAVFHHMPLPPRDKLAPDWKHILDFHQALGSLNAYPALQRALGIVFDLELPRDFVAESGPGLIETLSVADVSPGWAWAGPTATPELQTSYLSFRLDDGRQIFLTAPRALLDPSAPTTVIGLLDLDPADFGIAQVDVDGGMHKAIILAETWHDPDVGRNVDPNASPEPAQHPDVFDPEATMPSLRSGGLSLYADGRAGQLLDTIAQSKAFDDALKPGAAPPRPFAAEDLVRGYRFDIWDSATDTWHSLHARDEHYTVKKVALDPGQAEGFVQLAVTQPAPGALPATNDLYLHEAVARWAGWSLSVPLPGRHIGRAADPKLAAADEHTNQPKTPFKLTTSFDIVDGSLPRLRFGLRYRIRARTVDLAGNSLQVDQPLADELAQAFGLPLDPDGFAYLRYEPVAAPLVVLRDPRGVTDPGSAVDRLVIRTYNSGPDGDETPADLTAADRHIVPPRTSVELAERHGMIDDASGHLKGGAATWKLLSDRDAGQLPTSSFVVAGKKNNYAVVPADRIDALPYLPDPLSRGAALRDLPGTPTGALGEADPAAAAPGAVAYNELPDPNPRPGSATIVPFTDEGDWTTRKGFRLQLDEPTGAAGSLAPLWDPGARLLQIFLPKGATTTVPLTSWIRVADLPLLGQWQWLREAVEQSSVSDPAIERPTPLDNADLIAHVLQRAVEGGHWLLSPPRLITLVHAVEQPIGRPEFTGLDVQHDPAQEGTDPLRTEPITGRTDPTELASLTAWRRPGATDAYLIGALRVHGASTAKVDLRAEWDDPVDTDDPAIPRWSTEHHEAPVDELPLTTPAEDYLLASGSDLRPVGYYDPEHDQIAFVRSGDWIGRPDRNAFTFSDAAPRHLLNDTKHHRIRYTAVSTSRFREYFADDTADFTRVSLPIDVDVPASSRPLAPLVAYVVPTFGWQRQVETNIMRSVRFGGGLRVYLRRPWFSSGDGELLGVALWSNENGTLDREAFKPLITQWGNDPIWQTESLSYVPWIGSFPNVVAWDEAVPLEESLRPDATSKFFKLANFDAGTHPVVDVVGFQPEYDEDTHMWFADVTIDLPSDTYMPFIRLALVRYQPNALLDAKVSRVVLTDFAQLTPHRAATVTSDPYHPRRVYVALSGVTPQGPPAPDGGRPTSVTVRVQRRNPVLTTDLGWEDVPDTIAAVEVTGDPGVPSSDLSLWTGTVTFADGPIPGRFRLVIEERELIHPGSEGEKHAGPPGRLVYAETFELDHTLLGT